MSKKALVAIVAAMITIVAIATPIVSAEQQDVDEPAFSYGNGGIAMSQGAFVIFLMFAFGFLSFLTLLVAYGIYRWRSNP